MRWDLLIPAVLLASTPAGARQWPDTAGWEVHEAANFCYMWMDYEGPGETEFSLAIDIDDRVMFMIVNRDWSVEPGKPYKIAVDMADQTLTGPATGEKGDAYPYKRGLRVLVGDDKFLTSFAKSPYMHFYLDPTPGEEFAAEGALVLDKLKLSGSAAALAQVKKCVAAVKRDRTAEARAKAEYETRWRGIPKDPFITGQQRPETPLTTRAAPPEVAEGRPDHAPQRPSARNGAPEHWVQVGGGANREALAKEFRRLQAKVPKLLSGTAGWSVPLRATHRLLVGPFPSAAKAQEFVNELAKADLPAFSWTNPAGQIVESLPAGH
jgi:hypothetical protein